MNKVVFTHYVIFGEDKPYKDMVEYKKAWADYEKALKKYNLKMVGPFGPFGVSEGAAVILEGSISDFEKYIGSEAMEKAPMTKARTISLWKLPMP